jgi:hypothetical protein
MAPANVIWLLEVEALTPEAPLEAAAAKADTAAVAEVTPVVLNSSRPLALVIEKMFEVPVPDFTTRARPPLPVVSIRLASAPEILLISSIKPWRVLLLELIVIVVVDPFITNANEPVSIVLALLRVLELSIWASVRSNVIT